MTADEVVRRLNGKWSGNQALARCPVRGHGRGRGDLNPSLSIAEGERGAVLVNCFAGCRAEDVLAAAGVTDSDRQVSRAQEISPGKDARRHRSDLPVRLWAQARPLTATFGETYLRSRGIVLSSNAIRFLPDAWHPSDASRRLPAMLAAIMSPGGDLCAVQCTYLHPNGAKAAAHPGRKTFGKLGRGAVHLAPAGESLALAEGVETALSAMQLFDVPTWAACGARLDKVSVPPIVRQVLIVADHDAAGMSAGLAAGRHFRGLGFAVEIYRPRNPGWDWNDALRSQEVDLETTA